MKNPTIETLTVPDLIPDTELELEAYKLVTFHFVLEGYCIYRDMVRKGYSQVKEPLERVPENLKLCGFDFDQAYQDWEPIAAKLKLDTDELIPEAMSRLYFVHPLAKLALGDSNAKHQLDEMIICTWLLFYEYLDQDYSRDQCTHMILLQILPIILDFKIQHRKRFGNLEKVLEYLSEEEQTKALFHLDVLR